MLHSFPIRVLQAGAGLRGRVPVPQACPPVPIRMISRGGQSVSGFNGN